MRDLDLNAELLKSLSGLIANWENEVVEFKQASNNFRQDDIGQYFSAISNEANLRGLQYGWLVFGINNKTRSIVGSDYRYNAQLIINYLKLYKKGKKSDFVELLKGKLSDILDQEQKENKIRNILAKMKQDGIIERAGGNRRTGFWILTIDY
jgi:predicted HTH transcriptional regulator